MIALVQSLTPVRLSATPWIAARQASLVHHQLPEFTQTHVHQVSDAIQPSHPLLSPSPSACNLSQHQGLFQWVSPSHQVAKTSASTSVPPMDIQGWFSLGLTRLFSLQFKGLSRVFSSTIVQKPQFLGIQLSLWFNSHIHPWLLENYSFDYMDLCWQSDFSAF